MYEANILNSLDLDAWTHSWYGDVCRHALTALHLLPFMYRVVHPHNKFCPINTIFTNSFLQINMQFAALTTYF
jgi:hypothetical protein